MTGPPDPTSDRLRERSRELLRQGMVGVEAALDAGRREDAAAALRLLLNRTDPEVAREVIEHGAVEELARENGWFPPRRPDIRYVPASRVQVRRGQPRSGDPRRVAGDAVAAAYAAEQALIPDKPERDTPVWGDLDYDRAALYDLRGATCLGCKLERTRSDLSRRDGLCVECREAGLTRDGVIEGYCARIAQNNSWPQAVRLLRSAWTRSSRPDDKAVIAAWVAKNEALLTTADGPVAPADAPTPQSAAPTSTESAVGDTARASRLSGANAARPTNRPTRSTPTRAALTPGPRPAPPRRDRPRPGPAP